MNTTVTELSIELFADSSKWIDKAACRHTEVDMLQARPSSAQYEVCESCVVFDDCRAELLSINPVEIAGVWAGLSNSQWRALRKGNKEKSPLGSRAS
jgi:hypothetical protein